MSRTPSAQQPGQSLGKRILAGEDTSRQLRERMLLLPKPKPPVGAIKDLAMVYTSDPVGIPWAAGSSEATYAAPSYTVEFQGDGGWLTVANGNLTVTKAGFYHATCWGDIRWPDEASGPGPSVSVSLNGNPSDPGGEYVPTYQAGLLWGLVKRFSNGVEWMDVGMYWMFEADGTPTSADIAKSGLSWRIAQYA